MDAQQDGWREWSRHVLSLLEDHGKKLDDLGQRVAVIKDSQRSDLQNFKSEMMHEIGSLRQETSRIQNVISQNQSNVQRLEKQLSTIDQLRNDVTKLQERMNITWGFVTLLISSLIGVAIKVFGG